MSEFLAQSSAEHKPPFEIDTNIILDAQSDSDSFAKVYDYYVDNIYRYIFSCIKNESDAQDVTSQVFLSAYLNLCHYNHRGNFTAWIFTIARNKVKDFYRGKKAKLSFYSLENHGTETDMLADVVYKEDIVRLRSAIRMFSTSEQELIRLRYVAKLSFMQIALLLRQKEDTVKKRLYRLITHLEHQMEDSNE